MSRYVLSLLLAGLSSFVVPFVFNRMDEKAFCDYGELPETRGEDPRVPKKAGLLFFVPFAFLNSAAALHERNLWFVLLCGVIFATLALTALSDIRYYIIPDEFVIALAAEGVLFSVIDVLGKSRYLHENLLFPLFGGILGGGLLLSIGFLGGALFRKEAMGFGDVKLLFACGLFLGVRGVLSVLVITVVTAGLFCLLLILFKKLNLSSHLPFGPFICLSSALYLCFFEEIRAFVGWYMSLFF